MSGLIDPATARKLGKIAGVDAILTGTITPFGDEVRLSVKVLATDTAKIICASRGNIPKTKAIGDLINRGIVGGTQQDTLVTPKDKRYVVISKVQANNFTFELEQCKRSGKNVTCDLLITNNDEDRELVIYNRNYETYCRIFDDFGNEYGAFEVQIGKEKGNHPEILLVSSVPTRATLYFDKVSPKANKITLLELGCQADKHFRAQLRNIPITK